MVGGAEADAGPADGFGAVAALLEGQAKYPKVTRERRGVAKETRRDEVDGFEVVSTRVVR